MKYQRIVIVGGSLAGIKAAQTLRRLGHDGTLTTESPWTTESDASLRTLVPGVVAAGQDGLRGPCHRGARGGHLDRRVLPRR